MKTQEKKQSEVDQKSQKTIQQRQGDLLFVPISEDSYQSLKSKFGKKLQSGVLITGESGHSHVVRDFHESIEIYANNEGDLLIKTTDQPLSIDHEEHQTITLPPSHYRMKRQEEWDWATEETQKVLD